MTALRAVLSGCTSFLYDYVPPDSGDKCRGYCPADTARLVSLYVRDMAHLRRSGNTPWNQG